MSTTDLGNKKIFSNNLQTFIDRQNLAVPQLAEKLGIKYTTFRDWVKGNTYPRIDKIELLADYFGVKKSALVERDGAVNVSPTHSYQYFDTDIAAGALTTVDGLTDSDVEQIQLSDAVMGRYAGDTDLFVTNINGESMNRVIPNGSLVVVKAIDSFQDLSDGEVVIFCEDEESYSVKGVGMPGVTRFTGTLCNKRAIALNLPRSHTALPMSSPPYMTLFISVTLCFQHYQIVKYTPRICTNCVGYCTHHLGA